MLLAPKYEGLDLPVHDPDTFVATNRELKSPTFAQDFTGNYTVPKIVRAVAIQLKHLAHAPRSAAEMLDRTDRELDAVAELCGALVVGYEWGLYKVDGRDPTYRKYIPALQGLGGIIDLPKNHILVAEVDVVKPTVTEQDRALGYDAPWRAEVREGVSEYYGNGSGTYQLFDMRFGCAGSARTDQFISGAPVTAVDGAPQTHLVDIEPRFALTR